MAKNYYISDLHLLHNNCLKFDNRPFSSMEEMMGYIKENWNYKITNADTVYILGDISLRKTNEELISYVANLKGKKVLVKGNHDNVSDYRYVQLFDEIVDYKEITDTDGNGNNLHLILSHYPIFSWKNMGRGWILLHGHVHESDEERFFYEALENMYERDQEEAKEKYSENKIMPRLRYSKRPIAINVGCMKSYMNYTPRTLEELLENYEERKGED